MLKMFFALIFLVNASVCYGTTVTASVAGTLKVYQILSATTLQTIVFPAQFAQTLASPLINIQAGMPATGIPAIAGETQGQAGAVIVSGSGGTLFTPSVTTPLSLSGPSTISAALTLWGDPGYTSAAPTAISGTNGQANQNAGIYIKGIIASSTALLAGTYTGTTTVTISYN